MIAMMVLYLVVCKGRPRGAGLRWNCGDTDSDTCLEILLLKDAWLESSAICVSMNLNRSSCYVFSTCTGRHCFSLLVESLYLQGETPASSQGLNHHFYEALLHNNNSDQVEHSVSILAFHLDIAISCDWLLVSEFGFSPAQDCSYRQGSQACRMRFAGRSLDIRLITFSCQFGKRRDPFDHHSTHYVDGRSSTRF